MTQSGIATTPRASCATRSRLDWIRAIGAAVLLGVAASPPAPAETSADGDLWGGTRTFAATLSAGYQPVVTKSNGTGAARIVLDITSRTIHWEVEYANLTSPPTAIGLHGPAQAGTNGAVLIDLGGKSLNSPIRGSVVVTPGQIQYMLLGWTYVLVSTRSHPNGELRGKLDVVPPRKPASGRP